MLLESFWPTVLAPIEPWGSIFQNGILGGVQFKICLKEVSFYKNLFISTILEHTKIGKMQYSACKWGSIQDWGSIRVSET